MADPLTPNKSLAQPTRGSDIGVWDTPVNANMGILDNSLGGVATIALTNANVQLSSAQYQCAFIKLTGTLSGNILLTFPGGIGSFFTILNQTVAGTNAITMNTTAAGSQTIGIPPNENRQVFIDGTNPQFHGLPPVGSYMHFGYSSAPNWITNCTVQPFLNCDGTSFSSATYPALTTYLGSNTLPDTRGRALFTLDQGTGRNGGAFLGGGGNANTSITIAQANLPNVNLNANSNPVNLNQGNIVQANAGFVTGALTGGAQYGMNATPSQITPTVTLPTYSLGGSGTPITTSTISPAIVHGITMVRAG
jgi:hypothetical protein